MNDRSEPMTFMQKWQRVARRIRVPLGFASALLYLWELVRHQPSGRAVALSLLLVTPGLWLRGYAAGYVKKNRELTMTGPYGFVRNPLYLGSILIAAGFALALESLAFAALLLAFLLLIYIPVIVSEEAFLRSTFPEFEWYCARVPRLIPRLTQLRFAGGDPGLSGSFSFELYQRHREYNSAVGATLLYGSLLLAMLIHSRLAR